MLRVVVGGLLKFGIHSTMQGAIKFRSRAEITELPLAVLLDLGDVFVALTWERAYQALAAAGPFAAKEVGSRLAAAGLPERYESGSIDSQEFYERLKALMEFTLNFDEFAAIWCDIFEPAPLLSEPFIDQLSERCQVTIASNTNPLHFDYLERTYPILSRFPRRALSFQLGAIKPQGAFFERALEIAGRSASECLLVDDQAENVRGARAVGIDGEIFKGEAVLLSQLFHRGIRLTGSVR